ncbi:MAG: ABC transporter substrate-binding protein [Actinomycetota bacterium]|nr:ABC transporter substrate-binding protein [Actinomycetota bacterium]
MKGRTSTRVLAALAAGSLLVVACSDDKDAGTTTAAPTTEAGGTDTTEGGTTETTEGGTTETTEPAPTGWAVNTDDCIDPAAANAVIEGPVKIGSVMPLSGDTSADEAFAPVKVGFEAYFDYASENGLLGDLEIEVQIEDDQYSKDLTPGKVSKLLDDGAQVISAIVGTPNNLAVRDNLNEECIPQIEALTGDVRWGNDVANYPWTSGDRVPYDLEAKVYAAQIAEQFPEGARVSLYYIDTDFGKQYADTFKEVADEYGIEIVSEDTVGATDSAPPVAQVTNIAANTPDAIMAVPLGIGCVTFLNELASKRAVTAGWTPPIFITNTCASSLILNGAGASADGIYTSNNLVDVTDPSVADVPAVQDYVAYMTSIGQEGVMTTAEAGWTAAEVTVAILLQAAASPEGLTRASIINATRNFTYTPSLARTGVTYKSSGEEDGYMAQSLQVLQYDADTKTFTSIGDLVTEFES